MKNIAVAIDGLKYKEPFVRQAIQIALINEAHLTGLFFEDDNYHSYKISELLETGGLSFAKQDLLDKKDEQKRSIAVQKFERACKKFKINYSIKRLENDPMRELLHKSYYSDLLILNEADNFNPYHETLPTSFSKDLLAHSHCPVLLLTNQFTEIKKVVVLYDGSPSSVFAVKSFCQLLPNLAVLPTEVISISTTEQNVIPDEKEIKDFMKLHFPKSEFLVKPGNPSADIPVILHQIKTPYLIVTGSYHRSRVSRWFKTSMADILIQEVKVPIFVAHN